MMLHSSPTTHLQSCTYELNSRLSLGRARESDQLQGCPLENQPYRTLDTTIELVPVEDVHAILVEELLFFIAVAAGL